MADAPTVPDGLELRKDGTARLTIDGKGWRLRRPKLGEFRTLRTLAQERDDERRDQAQTLMDGLTPDPGKDAKPEQRRTYLTAVTAMGRQLEELTDSLNEAWLTKAFAMLADSDGIPDPDDWPAGLQSSDTIGQLMEHWRSVPLRSGGA